MYKRQIIGNVRIGNQCIIGANCVVTKDVPDRATVVLAKPRVFIHEEEGTICTVSYTHLDVYKRQLQSFQKNLLTKH